MMHLKSERERGGEARKHKAKPQGCCTFLKPSSKSSSSRRRAGVRQVISFLMDVIFSKHKSYFRKNDDKR